MRLWPRILGLVAGALLVALPAVADYQPGTVMQLPNVSAVTTRNLVNTPNISIAGYYTANDGGQGNFVLGASPSPTTMTGQTHSPNTTTTLDNLSANPLTQNWSVGFPITDSAGAIPANTYIIAVSSTTITISQPATSHQVGDTFTVGCANGGIVIQDSANHCFYRTNTNGNLAQWGVATGSVYDAEANPLTVSDSSTVFSSAMAILVATGINNFRLNGTSVYWTSSPTFQIGTTLDCGGSAPGPYTGGNYLGRPGTIFLKHGASVHIGTIIDGTPLTNCSTILPYWLQNPAEAVTDCSLDGNPGQSFTSLPATYDDLEKIQANATICGDTGLFVDTSSGAYFSGLGIFGFDQGAELNKADHTTVLNSNIDANNCVWGNQGGGLTAGNFVNCDNFLTRQIYVGGVKGNNGCVQNISGGQLICNEEYWNVSNITAGAVNSFGTHNCRLSLTPGTSNNTATNTGVFSTFDLKNSLVKANGDPIMYKGWMANLNNVGLSVSGAVSCNGHGPWAINVISADGTNATIDLVNSELGTGSDKIVATGVWPVCSIPPCTIYLESGDLTAIQYGEVVSDGVGGTNGITPGSKVIGICLNICKGLDPYDGAIAAITLDSPVTVAKTTDTALTFDALAFAASGAQCAGGSAGYCFFLNTAEKVFGGASAASVANAALPESAGHAYADAFSTNGTAGFNFANSFAFGHHYDVTIQDANNSIFTAFGSDGNGELNDFGKIGRIFSGASNNANQFGYQSDKEGAGFETDAYKTTDDTGSANTTTVNMAALTTGIGNVQVVATANFPTDKGVGVTGGHFNFGICQTPNAGPKCPSNREEYVTAEIVDGTHFKLLARGQFYSAPITYSDPATIIYTAVSSSIKSCDNLNGTSNPVTAGGLNAFNVAHGCLMLNSTRLNGSNRGAFISGNATMVSINGALLPGVQLLYENPTALSIMGGCSPAVAFLSPQSWNCYSAQPTCATLSASVTIDNTCHFILCDATAAPVTISIPAGSLIANAEDQFKKIDSTANACTISMAGGDTLDGAVSYILARFGQSVDIQNANGGTAWYVK